MTPHILQHFREEYSKRIHSGLCWNREGVPNSETGELNYFHESFDAKKFLSRFTEEEAAAIAEGIAPPPRKYKEDKQFAKVRRMLAELDEEERQTVLEMFNLQKEGE